MKWIDESCNHCGECCIEYPTIRFISPDEWESILSYIKKEKGGTILIKFFNSKIRRYLTIPYQPKIGEFSLGSDLFWILDVSINPCPFLRFDLGDACYYCEIQEIKPEVCKKFFCEPHGTTSLLYREHILNFGHAMEYPRCIECKEYDFVLDRPRYEDEATECERGEGCRFLERRVRYFLRYAKTHSGQSENLQFAKALISILYKQEEVFENQLNSDLHLQDSQINFNRNKYIKMIDDIKKVVGPSKF